MGHHDGDLLDAPALELATARDERSPGVEDVVDHHRARAERADDLAVHYSGRRALLSYVRDRRFDASCLGDRSAALQRSLVRRDDDRIEQALPLERAGE